MSTIKHYVKRAVCLAFLCLVSTVLLCSGASADVGKKKGNASDYLKNQHQPGFVENKGQLRDQNNRPNPEVLFLLNMNGLNVQIRKNGFSYDTYKEQDIPGGKASEENTLASKPIHFHRIDVNFENCQERIEIEKVGISSSYMNYIEGGNSNSGVSSIYNFQKLICHGVYPGIDIEFLFNSSSKEKPFEYNFIVHPKANPSLIRLKYKGQNRLWQEDGKLKMEVSNGILSEYIPSTFVKETGSNIRSTYNLINNVVSFELGKYNKSKTLIIDPAATKNWGTYVGGASYELATDVFYSSSAARVGIVGFTQSTSGFASSGVAQGTHGGGYYDGFVASFNGSTGALEWKTYYGTALNFERLEGGAFYGDKVVVCGWRTTVTDPIPADEKSIRGYLGILKSDGTSFDYQNLSWGGSVAPPGSNGAEPGGTQLLDLAIDGDDVFVTGFSGANYPYSNVGLQDAIVMKWPISTTSGVSSITTNNSPTLLGTNANERFTSITVKNNNVYVAGFGEPSTSNPSNYFTLGSTVSNSGSKDIVFAKLAKSNLAISWSRYYGGSGSETIEELDLDANENLYVVGNTTSGSLSTDASSCNCTSNVSGIIVSVNTSGAINWSTYFGGTSDDYLQGISLEPSTDLLFYSGVTKSSSLALNSSSTYGGGGNFEGVLGTIKTNGTKELLMYSGVNSSYSIDFNLFKVAAYNASNIFYSGIAENSGLATGGAHQTTISGSSDMILFRYQDCAPRVSDITVSGSPANVCTGRVYTLTAVTTGTADSYTWVLPSGWTGSSSTNSISCTTSTSVGTGVVQVTASSTACGNGNTYSESITLTLTPTTPSSMTIDNAAVAGTGEAKPCVNDLVTFESTNGSGWGYTWSLSGGNWLAYSGSTSSAYQVLTSDRGASVTVSVRYTNAGCTSDPLSNVYDPTGSNMHNLSAITVTNPVLSPSSGTITNTTSFTMTGGSGMPGTEEMWHNYEGNIPFNTWGATADRLYNSPTYSNSNPVRTATGAFSIAPGLGSSTSIRTVSKLACYRMPSPTLYTFTIQRSCLPKIISSAGGTSFTGSTTITIYGMHQDSSYNCSNDTIRYTTNGTTPGPASTIYTAPFSISATTNVKAIAYNRHTRIPSTVTSVLFTKTGARMAIAGNDGESGPFSLEIYPNPSNGKFRIESNMLVESGSVEIIDLSGKKVEKLEMKNTDVMEVDLRKRPSGIYIIKFMDSAGSRQFRVIKE